MASVWFQDAFHNVFSWIRRNIAIPFASPCLVSKFSYCCGDDFLYSAISINNGKKNRKNFQYTFFLPDETLLIYVVVGI